MNSNKNKKFRKRSIQFSNITFRGYWLYIQLSDDEENMNVYVEVQDQ